MSKFSRWTPTLGVRFKWNDQKGPKIAHLGIFRHIWGVGGSENIWTPKYDGSWPIAAKIVNLGPPGAPQYFFQKKNQNVRITVHLDIRVQYRDTFSHVTICLNRASDTYISSRRVCCLFQSQTHVKKQI